LSQKALRWSFRKDNGKKSSCALLFRRHGVSLLEGVVAAGLFAVLFAVTAAALYASQRVIQREGEKQKGLWVAFGVAQRLLTVPFDRLPPERFVGEERTVTVRLSFPLAAPQSLHAITEGGTLLPVEVTDPQQITVRLPSPQPFFVGYRAKWREGDFEVEVVGEFVDEGIRPTKAPTDLKRLWVFARRGEIKCPPLWLLRGRWR